MKHDQDPWATTGSPPEDWPVTPPPATPATGRAGQDKDPRAPGGRGQPGTCYLLHFSEPYQHARHHSGTAADLPARLAEHEAGRGSRLLQVAKAAGITWTLARTWPGGRQRERQLKNQGGASRRCPECGVKPRTNPGERKEAAGMTQPPEENAGHARGIQPPELGATTWAHAQLRDQIQRTVPRPEAGQANSRQLREADGSPLPDVQAEPTRTAPDHADEPPTRQQITGAAVRAEAAARRADEHARAARSVDCECQARTGAPCDPSGDHLARYLRAHQSGALTKDSLTQVITELDVIAPRALIQSPSERAASARTATTAGHATRGQPSADSNADRAGAPAHSAARGRSRMPAPVAEELRRSDREASAIYARQDRELEAGS
jgi:predicted GIY-YIG superfamily endonuclease